MIGTGTRVRIRPEWRDVVADDAVYVVVAGEEAGERRAWGRWDAVGDKAAGRDRRATPSGELFALPQFDPDYCAGYREAMAEE